MAYINYINIKFREKMILKMKVGYPTKRNRVGFVQIVAVIWPGNDLASENRPHFVV